MSHQVKLKIGEEDLILETGKIAKQANGSVFGWYAGVDMDAEGVFETLSAVSFVIAGWVAFAYLRSE